MNKLPAKRRPTTAKKTTAKRKAPRRRMSGGIFDSNTLMTVAALGAGAIAAREANTILVKQFPTLSPLMVGVGQIAAGVLLPTFIKSQFGRNLGNGMIAFGVQVVAVSVGVISGTGDRMSYRVNGGTSRLQPINGGTSRLLALNGAPATQAEKQRKFRNF